MNFLSKKERDVAQLIKKGQDNVDNNHTVEEKISALVKVADTLGFEITALALRDVRTGKNYRVGVFAGPSPTETALGELKDYEN